MTITLGTFTPGAHTFFLHAQATAELFSAVGLYPEAGELYMQAASDYASIGDHYSAGNAVFSARKALDNIGDQNTHLHAAIARFRMAEIIKKREDGDPETVRNFYLEAAGEINKALPWYEETDRKLEASQLLFLKGIVLDKAGEYFPAAKTFHTSWEKSRTAYTAWRAGLALMSAGLFVEAADGPLQTAAEASNSAGYLLLQGAVYYSIGEALLLAGLFFDARYAFNLAGSTLARLANRYAKMKLPEALIVSARGWSGEAGEAMNEINRTAKFTWLKGLAEDVQAGKDGAVAELANALGVDRDVLVSELNAGEGNLHERLVRTVGPNSVGAPGEEAGEDDSAVATEGEGAVL